MDHAGLPHLVVVLTTVAGDTDALALGRALVEERLAACVNVLGPMTSIYRWKGDVESSAEQQLVIKTTEARLPDLTARLLTLHAYEVPELIVIRPSDVSGPYSDWVVDSVG